jgi:hypothetical protein
VATAEIFAGVKYERGTKSGVSILFFGFITASICLYTQWEGETGTEECIDLDLLEWATHTY